MVAWFGVLVLGLLVLLVVGGVTGIIYLLINERTRVIGGGLVFGSLLGLIVAVVLGSMWSFTRVSPQRTMVSEVRAVQAAERAHAEAIRQLEFGENSDRELVVVASSSPRAETADGEAAASAPGADTPLVAEAEQTPVPKPDWIDTEPRFIGDAYLQPVAVGPCRSKFECERRVDAALREAAGKYAMEYLGRDRAHRAPMPLDYIHEHLVQQRWQEDVKTSFGVPMTRLHYLLRYDDEANRYLDEAWRRAVSQDRLWLAGTSLLAVLGLLTTGFAYLRTDLATRGAHRRRLRLLAGSVVVVLVAALAWLVRLQL
jgi:hypothetical protein